MKKVCSGTYIVGVDFDLVEWAGVILTDDEYVKLWSEINEVDLIELCDSAIIDLDQEDDDTTPGTSANHFSVYTTDEASMKEELWQHIIRILTSRQRLAVNVP